MQIYSEIYIVEGRNKIMQISSKQMQISSKQNSADFLETTLHVFVRKCGKDAAAPRGQPQREEVRRPASSKAASHSGRRSEGVVPVGWRATGGGGKKKAWFLWDGEPQREEGPAAP